MVSKIPVRNSLEREVADLLLPLGFAYEKTEIHYTLDYIYTPDFTRGHIHVETKGKFDPEDRRKILHLRRTYPDEVVLMVFYNARQRIRKNSKTTYGEWCTKNNIPWVDIKTFRKEYKQCLSSLNPMPSRGASKTPRKKRNTS